MLAMCFKEWGNGHLRCFWQWGQFSRWRFYSPGCASFCQQDHLFSCQGRWKVEVVAAGRTCWRAHSCGSCSCPTWLFLLQGQPAWTGVSSTSSRNWGSPSYWVGIHHLSWVKCSSFRIEYGCCFDLLSTLSASSDVDMITTQGWEVCL